MARYKKHNVYRSRMPQPTKGDLSLAGSGMTIAVIAALLLGGSSAAGEEPLFLILRIIYFITEWLQILADMFVGIS